MSKKWMGKKVGVLMGGFSKEREISLKTGNAIFKALSSLGYDCVSIDCERDLFPQLKKAKIDVAFIALHGPFGEDGAIQGILEWLQIPYTGSSILASSLAMDKAVLNQFARHCEILVPEDILWDASKEPLEDFIQKFGGRYPVIVKPSREGSTINITIVHEPKNLKIALQKALESDTKILVEKFIQGKEVTIAVLNGVALPSIEIVPKSGFYDYTSKYTKGASEYLLPARVSAECVAKMNRICEKLYAAIDCSGVVRADFIVVDEEPYFLEINTIPGMTETSLVPKAAKHAGISFEKLCEEILDEAKLHLKS